MKQKILIASALNKKRELRSYCFTLDTKRLLNVSKVAPISARFGYEGEGVNEDVNLSPSTWIRKLFASFLLLFGKNLAKTLLIASGQQNIYTPD